MPILGKTRAQIETDLLADWTARMVAAGFSSFNASQSPFCVGFVRSFALDLEAHESNAETLEDDIIPSANTPEDTMARHLAVDGLAPAPATVGTWRVTVTGATGAVGGTTYSTVGRKLVSRSGYTYTPPASFVMPFGASSVQFVITADEPGTASSLNASDVLTWTAAPAGIDPTVAVVNAVTTPEDAQTAGDMLEELLAYRRGRPASGSPPWWCETAEGIAGVHRAFCYPCLKPHVGGYADTDLDTLGCVTIVVLGPPQGDSTTSSLLVGGVGGVEPAAVRGYFLGTHDAAGNATADGPIRYPGTMDPADLAIETPLLADVGIDLTLTLDAVNAYPWTGTMTVDGTSTATSLVVTGDQRAKNGLRALVFVGTTHIRGGYQLVVLPNPSTSNYDAGSNKTTWDLTQTPLNGTPSGSVYPAPGNWEALRLAIFDLFDTLGPGDVPTKEDVPEARAVNRRRRYPPESYLGKPDIYLARIAGVVLGVQGNTDVVINTPVADQVAGKKQVFRLTTFLVH